MIKDKNYSKTPTQNFDTRYWLEGDIPQISSIIEENTDEPIGNFTGLYNRYGQPLFRPKNKIGFIINGK